MELVSQSHATPAGGSGQSEMLRRMRYSASAGCVSPCSFPRMELAASIPSYDQAEITAVNYFEIIRVKSSDSQKRYFVLVVIRTDIRQ